MDVIKASGCDVVRASAAGQVFKFPRLRLLLDLAPMLAELQALERLRLLAAMNDAKMPPADRAKALIEFDREQYSMSKGILWAFSPTGTAKTILRSMQRSNPSATDADVDNLPLPLDTLRTVAAELWGHIPTPASDATTAQGASQGGDAPSDPPKPPTPQTGS